MVDKVSLIKIEKNVSSKVELAKAVVNITTTLNDVKISDTEATIMAYFMVYGVSYQTKVLLTKSEVCKNLNTVKIMMVKLKKLGLIYKDDLNNKVYVNKNLKFNLTPVIGVYLKLNTI